jgi:hypothetical protein
MGMVKSVYKGLFDMPHQAYIEYARACSIEQARIVLGRRVAKKQGVLPVVVMTWMKENPERYLIKLETEWTEINEEGMKL